MIVEAAKKVVEAQRVVDEERARVFEAGVFSDRLIQITLRYMIDQIKKMK